MKLENMVQGLPFQHKEFSDMESAEGQVRLFYTNEGLQKIEDHMNAQGMSNVEDTMACFSEGPDKGYFMGNLWISQANFSLAEKSQLEPHLSDMASIHFFGKSPTVASFTGHLINPYNNEHKQAMFLAYKNAFRLYSVARTGAVPNLSFTGYTMAGAMLKMNMVERGDLQGAIQITFDWLVFRIIVQSLLNTSPLGTTETAINFTGQPNEQ